jgi:translin
MPLKDFLEKIQEDLTKKEKVREEIQKDMRKATRLSKQAIQVIHKERLNDAIILLNEAKDLFSRLREISKKYPHIFYSGFVGAAFEEHAEAHILLTLIQEDRFIGPREIDVPIIPYLLSLGDVIGELRRRVLDLIRRGDVKASEKYLEIMENIYFELTALDDAYVIVNGLRRKCDVARRLIELTRGDITIEVRRSALEHSISNLEKKIEKTKD